MIWLLFSIVSLLHEPRASSALAPAERALLVVSYDAFRPDYLYRNVTPNLNRLRREGSTAQFMVPVFPTKTFVNHFSIATVSYQFIACMLMLYIIYLIRVNVQTKGLYPDKHGVLANKLYDSEHGKLKYSYELFHFSNSTIPIWVSESSLF